MALRASARSARWRRVEADMPVCRASAWAGRKSESKREWRGSLSVVRAAAAAAAVRAFKAFEIFFVESRLDHVHVDAARARVSGRRGERGAERKVEEDDSSTWIMSMSMQPVRGSVAACCMATRISRSASATSLRATSGLKERRERKGRGKGEERKRKGRSGRRGGDGRPQAPQRKSRESE